MNAKQIFAITILASSIAITGCKHTGTSKNDNKAGTETADSGFSTEKISYKDSITIKESGSVCSIEIDFPKQGNEQTLAATKRWIAKQLGMSSKVNNNDGSVMVKDRVGQLLAEDKSDIEKIYAQDPDPSYMFPYEYTLNISLIANTGKYLTYSSNNYEYSGGAHGSTVFSAQSFAQDNGSLIGYNMFEPGTEDDVLDIVKEGIRTQYFEVSPDKFQQELLVDESQMSLPATEPYLMPDGVHFIYQQYEIAPYSAGMPGCVIPYKTLMPYMTPTVKGLIR